MEPPTRPSRHTLRALVVLAVFTALAWLGWATFGRRLLLGALTGARGMPSMIDPSKWQVRTALARLLDPTFTRLLIFVWGVALAAMILPRFDPKSRAGRVALDAGGALVTTLLMWFAVESFVAPLVVRPLRLLRFYTVYDVDHRMPPSDPTLPTNSDGLRCTRESDAYPAGATNIIFLGDSYTYGFPLRCEESFPYRVEEMLRREFPAARINVVNFAWVSSSPYLSLRLLEQVGAKYHPRLVIQCVDMTDFFDDIHYRNMVEKRGIYWYFDKIPVALRLMTVVARKAFDDWEASTNGVDPPRRFFMSEAPLDHTRRYGAPLRGNLDAIDSCSTRLGARFMVLALPRAYQYSARECPNNWEKGEYDVLGPYALEPFRWFGELSREVRYPVHSLLSDFQHTTVFPTCLSYDPHWNPAGQWVAARAITRLLEPVVESETGLRPVGAPAEGPARTAGARGPKGPAAR